MNDQVLASPSGMAMRAPRRGRPLASSTAQRDADILEVAEQLFVEHGFRQVSLALVARSTCIATRTIYARFGGKRGMLDQIIERRSGDAGFAATLAKADADPKAALHRLATHVFDHALSAPVSLLHADVMAVRMPLASRGVCQLHSGLWYDTLAAVLEDGQWTLGTSATAGVDIIADFFIGCLMREFSTLAHRREPRHKPEVSCALADQTLSRFFSVVRLSSRTDH